MTDLAKEIWQTMRTNKLRTFLTGFSVAWGIFMLILLLAISRGVANFMDSFANKRDVNMISVYSGTTSLPYKGYKEGRDISLRTKYADAIMAADPAHITAVYSKMSFSGQISTSKDYLSSGSTSGVYPSAFDNSYKFLYGRPINQADINQRRKSIVLSDKSASVLFDDISAAVGKIVNVGPVAFTVVGIYTQEWDTDSFLPFTTATALSGYKDVVWRMDAYFKDVSDSRQSAEIEKKVRKALAAAASFDPDDPSAVYTTDRFANYEQQQTASAILNVTMWVIGILTLITGIVGVSNIMFVSVRERTHEIGIRRAIGAKPRNILVQVVMESVALTTCFGYIGIVMGTIATEGVKYAFRGSNFMVNPSVDMSIAVEVTVALVIAGALAGIFPALRAIKIRPVEALMEE